jgi:hypothetical protein
VTYEYTGEPIVTGVCHCDHCQRQSGSAFSVNVVLHESQLAVSGVLETYEETGEDGHTVYVSRRFCGSCGSPVVSEIAQPEGIIALKAGTLDDKSNLQPTVEAWCVARQPWVELPGIAVSLDREQPA